MEIKQRPQSEFPLIEEYRKIFPITKSTIFALGDTVYSDDVLPNHIWQHELCHLRQQKEYGLKEWVYDFLNYKNFRLEMEVKAYKVQLAAITDRNARSNQRQLCIKDLSGELYGNLLTSAEAMELLKA